MILFIIKSIVLVIWTLICFYVRDNLIDRKVPSRLNKEEKNYISTVGTYTGIAAMTLGYLLFFF